MFEGLCLLSTPLSSPSLPPIQQTMEHPLSLQTRPSHLPHQTRKSLDYRLPPTTPFSQPPESQNQQELFFYILSTGVNPNNRIPFPNTWRAASYSPINARFFSSLSAYMTLIVLAFLFS